MFLSPRRRRRTRPRLQDQRGQGRASPLVQHTLRLHTSGGAGAQARVPRGMPGSVRRRRAGPRRRLRPVSFFLFSDCLPIVMFCFIQAWSRRFAHRGGEERVPGDRPEQQGEHGGVAHAVHRGASPAAWSRVRARRVRHIPRPGRVPRGVQAHGANREHQDAVPVPAHGELSPVHLRVLRAVRVHHGVQVALPDTLVHRRHLVLRRRRGGAVHRGSILVDQAVPRSHRHRLEALLRIPPAARGERGGRGRGAR